LDKRWHITRSTEFESLDYTVRWSPWGSMDRWVINRLVPSEAGMFQLWVREGRGLVLLVTEPTYYGGLRNTLREVIDEMAPSGGRLRNLVDGRECWFRFSVCPYMEYLRDLKRWYGGGGEKEAFGDEGREILVNEMDEERKFAPPPPDVERSGRERMSDSDFGPKLPTPEGGYGPELSSGIDPERRA
jgi:hypothetical protein